LHTDTNKFSWFQVPEDIKHLLILASDKFESGEHIHYEAGIMLDNESADFVIEKI